VLFLSPVRALPFVIRGSMAPVTDFKVNIRSMQLSILPVNTDLLKYVVMEHSTLWSLMNGGGFVHAENPIRPSG
jgi:hypothetical protein